MSFVGHRCWLSISDTGKYAPFGTKTAFGANTAVDPSAAMSSVASVMETNVVATQPLLEVPRIGELVDAQTSFGVWFQVIQVFPIRIFFLY